MLLLIISSLNHGINISNFHRVEVAFRGLLPVKNVISFRKVSIGIEGRLLSTGSLEMHVPEVMEKLGRDNAMHDECR